MKFKMQGSVRKGLGFRDGVKTENSKLKFVNTVWVKIIGTS